jgi:hypothetical protein
MQFMTWRKNDIIYQEWDGMNFRFIPRIMTRRLRNQVRLLAEYTFRPVLGPTQEVSDVILLVVMRQRRKADHPHTSNSEVKNAWSCTITHSYVSGELNRGTSSSS